MERFWVSLFGGASVGGTYALIALGIVLIFRATGTFNFAHGEFMLLPAFLVGSWQADNRGNVAISMILGLVIVAAVGVAFYLLVLQRTTGLGHFMAVIATLGLASVLDGFMIIVFGSQQYSIDFPGLPTGAISIGGARISSESLVLTVFTLVLSIGVAVVLRFTPLGRRVRAAGQDPLLASQGGIHVRRLYLGSWAIASVLAGIAGIAYGTSNIVGSSMVDVALSAFPAILIGGLDSIEGAIVGGMLIGIFQGFIATYLEPKLLNVLTYGLLLAVMLVFPSGLFGTRTVARV